MIPASPDALPDDLDALRAAVLAERAEKQLLILERDRLSAANDKLHHMIAVLRRARFGRSFERLSEDQLNLVLEELETASAKAEAEEEKKDEGLKRERAKKRRANRGSLPAHLPRIEQIVEPESTVCPCCGEEMHVIGEDKSERLDKVPATLRVIVTRRRKYGCKCEEAVVQAPAPPRLIEGGIPTEALVADVVVSKYADHLPLYRQAQIFTRDGIHLDRSTMAAWVGAAAAELEPLHDRLVAILKGMGKLFADETRCPVLAPGRGNWLLLDSRLRRPAVGQPHAAGGDLFLRAGARRQTRGDAAGWLQRHSPGGWLRWLQHPQPSGSHRRAGETRILLGASAPEILRDRRQRPRTHRLGSTGTHPKTVQDRG